MDKKRKKILKTFVKMFKSCSIDNNRSSAPQKLKIRKNINIPEGTTFYLDQDLLVTYLSKNLFLEKKPNEIVAEVKINGKKDEFTFMEFQMLTATISDLQRKKMLLDLTRSSFDFVFKMYFQRYPYENSDK